MPYTLEHIKNAIHATLVNGRSAEIEHLLTDSRRLVFPSTTLFFAIKTNQDEGHNYIAELIERGVYNFVVESNFETSGFKDINFLKVDKVIPALQQLVANHRAHFTYPVIGITGSNGKTVVKEWLTLLLNDQFNIVRSPRSYNSQIGVPLSVWEMSSKHQLGIFEAGISQVGEMASLASIIQPTIGILTSIGSVHEEGFDTMDSKIQEKCQLFTNATIIIAPIEGIESAAIIKSPKIWTWSRLQNATLTIVSEITNNRHTQIKATFFKETYTLSVPFTDLPSINNVITCWLTLLYLKFSMEEIQKRILTLIHLDMRMQIVKGTQNCSILNDSYSNDIYSLQLALAYATQQAGEQPLTLILSDMGQVRQGMVDYKQVLQLLKASPLKRLITVGPELELALRQDQSFKPQDCQVISFNNTQQLLDKLDFLNFKDEFILIKGARVFELERIHKLLQQQVHQTQAEINLTALVNNFKKIKNTLEPSVKIMAMVKAFGYGIGSVEVARLLQFHHADYLAVAYVDEGVELRKAGIQLPIMVMNVDDSTFDTLFKYHLEPEIFSIYLFNQFLQFIKYQGIANFPIHLKLNTGMNRLGFDLHEMATLGELVKSNPILKVNSIFSHLSSSGKPEMEAYTLQQLNSFNKAAQQLETALGYSTLKHIANSGGIFMDKKFHLDMVRLGIGMYGIGLGALELEPVMQLTTTISQIRKVNKEETIGYNRSGVLLRDSIIATVRLGYADGYSRKLGLGKGSMWVNNQLAPIVGDICMDMTMIDITDIPDVQQGDRVQVFGNQLPIEKLAQWAQTIPYEILTTIGQRVKRIYIQD